MKLCMVQGLQKYLANFFCLDFGADFKQTWCVALAHTPVFAWNLIFQVMPPCSKYCIPFMLSTTVLHLSEIRTVSMIPVPSCMVSHVCRRQSEILGASGSGHAAWVMCSRLLSVGLWVTRWPFPFSFSVESMLLHSVVLQGCVLESSNDASIYFINASRVISRPAAI